MPGTAGDDLHSPAQNANARSGLPEQKVRVYNLLPKTAWSSALCQIANYTTVYCVSRESQGVVCSGRSFGGGIETRGGMHLCVAVKAVMVTVTMTMPHGNAPLPRQLRMGSLCRYGQSPKLSGAAYPEARH